ncbi:MAG: hypothetical protein JO256_12380 [Alphaproteobacteria bacterium]|nr:hypothetical protein [Alphaproteobacteria bacterium]
MTQITNGSDDVHQHSGWWFPGVILGAITLLSGVFLLYDLRPDIRPSGDRTSDTVPIRLSVGDLVLMVPANYLESRPARAGGPQHTVTLSALLPDLRGYTASEGRQFQNNAPDSPVVRFFFKAGEKDMAAEERLQRIYGPYLTDSTGHDSDFGLTQYTFRPQAAYGRSDLFAGLGGGRTLLFLCERADPQLTSPNCLVSGRIVAANVSFSWRFKRAYLARWQEVAAGVDRLLDRWTVH